MPGIFLTLKQVEGDAYVAQTTQQSADEERTRALYAEQGIPYVYIPLDEQSGWVEYQPDGAFTFRPRPALSGDFDKTTLLPGESATFPALPDRTKIVVMGPAAIVADWDAEGGEALDFQLGFSLPGTYRVILEAFPHARRLFDFTVSLPAADAAPIEIGQNIVGPDVEQLRTLAKYSAMVFYADAAKRDQVPDVVRAMYVRKAEEAQRVKNGGESLLISEEVRMRNEADPSLNLTVQQWADVILEMAKPSDDVELMRMRANIDIDAAPADLISIYQALGKHQIPLATSPASRDGTWSPM
ncbi:hypothetical protein [Methylobacterium oxalidis]|uniref:hypothetical protein n=1 Tax=Methylobacterium oxalidis TaxID=944322 RepID=UPI003315C2BC